MRAHATDLLPAKITRLREILLAASPLLVAYSGGVDSATLLALACETPGVVVKGILADSPSLPREALREAIDEAKMQGWPVEILPTRELEDPRYVANPVNRCFFCKAELFSRMEAEAEAGGYHSLAYGENADDIAYERPGALAAAQFQVLAPLREAGLSKSEIRTLARQRGLRAADAPAQPCLSSRIRHGIPVTTAALSLVEAAERLLAKRGYSIYRVRHVGLVKESALPRALVQVAPEETPRIMLEQEDLRKELQAVGFAEVEFDPQGYHGPSLAQ